MSNKKKAIIVLVEAIVLIVLMIVLFMRIVDKQTYILDLALAKSDIEKLTYNGEVWHINNDDGNLYDDSTYVLEGPRVKLPRGTYTIVIDYNSTEIHKASLETDTGIIDTTDYFLLSNNKNEVRYDFELKTDVEGFRFILKTFNGGEFTLKGISVIRNTHDIRCAIFLWIILSLFINAFIFLDVVRDNINSIAIVLGIAFMASLPLFPTGIMQGDDLRFHYVRIEAIADGIKSGYFPIKMYSIFNDGYGYPVSVFYGDLLLYIPALLRLVGFSIVASYKIYVFLVNLISAWMSFICGKAIFKRNIIAGIFSMCFTLSTYRLLCIYARAAVGEYTAMCFYPIIILAIWRIYTQSVADKTYKYNSIILAVGMAGLLYNHNLTLEMVGITLTSLAVALYKKTFRKETLFVYIYAFLIFLLIGAAFIIPFVDYYSKVDIMLKSMNNTDFYIQDKGAYLSDYFAVFKSITGGNYNDRRGLHTPGLVLMSGLAAGIYLIVNKKSDRKINILCIASVILLYVSSTLCPWNRIYEIPILGKLLTMVQFQYRYLGIAVCFMSLLLCFSIEKMIACKVNAKKIYGYVIGASIVMTCFFLSAYQDERFATGISKSYDTPDLYVLSRDGEFGLYMFVGGQFLINDTNVSKEALDYGVYGDNLSAYIVGEKGLKLDVYVTAGENSKLEVPRFAYPYFIATDQYKNRLQTICGHNNKVTVLFDKKYEGEVYIDFIEPWYWRIAELISLVSIIIIVILIVDKDANKK